MSYATMTDGTALYYKDWGQGQPVVFCHGWPLSADAWEAQMLFLAQHGFRTIAHDRRGMGRSDQPSLGNDMNTYADDLATLINALNLKNAILVGHSTGGGELVRYIARHGDARVSKIALVGAVPPFLLQTPSNPDGFPVEVYDGMRASMRKDRAQFFRDSALSFYNADQPGHTVSQGLLDSFWRQAMQAGLLGAHDCIKAFSETDFSEDLKAIQLPALVMHGDADQLVPMAISTQRSAKLLSHAQLEVIRGAPHGLFATHQDAVNAKLLAFAKGML